MLAIITSFGIWMVYGGTYHALMGAAVFMTLGLGVDDSFVIVDAVDNERTNDDDDSDLSIEEATAQRVGRGLARSGASITLTTVTNAAAFGACALTSTIPALTSFCTVTTICCAVDLGFQVTFFVAILALDVRRELRYTRAPVLQAVVLEEVPEEEEAVEAESPKSTPGSRRAAAMVSKPARIFTGAVTAVLVVLGCVGASKLDMDYESKWMAPDGSTVRGALDAEDRYFLKSNTWGVEAYSRGGNLFERLSVYREADSALAALPFSISQESWLQGFESWVQVDDRLNATEIFRSETAFDIALRAYAVTVAIQLATGQGGARALLAFRDDNAAPSDSKVPPTMCTTAHDISFYASASSRVCATHIPLIWNKAHHKATQIARIDRANAALARIGGTGDLGFFVARSPVLEALALIWPQTKRSVAMVAAVVFVVSFALLGRASYALLMLGVVSAIDVVLVGALYWLGEHVNMISVVVLTLAIGLSVDFSAHVAHAALHADGSSSRAVEALTRVFSPIIKGGGSTLLAVVPMALSQSYVIRLFFIVCLLIVTVGLFFGLAVVPCVLETSADVYKYYYATKRPPAASDGAYELLETATSPLADDDDDDDLAP